jgi:hypothetical protein
MIYFVFYHLCLCLPNGPFWFSHQNPAWILAPIHAACHARLMLLDSIIWRGEQVWIENIITDFLMIPQLSMSQHDAVAVCKIFYTKLDNVSRARCLYRELTMWPVRLSIHCTWPDTNLKTSVFWDISLCSPLKVNRPFEVTCRPQLQCETINKAKKSRMKQVAWIALFATCLLPDSFLAYSSTMKMEGKFASETSVVFHQYTRRYVPQDTTLHTHRYKHITPDTTLC